MNGAYTEDDSARDGFLSYKAEVHAFVHGLYKGLDSDIQRVPPQPDNPDVNAESVYYRGGYVATTVLQVFIIAYMTKRIVDKLS